MMKVSYYKTHPDAKILPPRFRGDVGFDICSIENKIIFPLFPREVRTGIILNLPEGVYCTIETRSGHGVKKNLRVHRGIIDSGFRGEITVKVYNHGILPYFVKKGERIAQLVFHRSVVPRMERAFRVELTERGFRGLGSTGRK